MDISWRRIRSNSLQNLSHQPRNGKIYTSRHIQSFDLLETQIYSSAVALSRATNASELNEGWLYPNINRIREVSAVVAREVIRQAQREGVDREPLLRDLDDEALDRYILERMYDPWKSSIGNSATRSGSKSFDADTKLPHKSHYGKSML